MGVPGSESCHRTEHQPRDDVRVPKLRRGSGKGGTPRRKGQQRETCGPSSAGPSLQTGCARTHGGWSTKGFPITGPIDGVARCCADTRS